MKNYYDWAARIHKPGPFDPKGSILGDTVDWPGYMVTEQDATPDTMKQFMSAQERLALVLIADEPVAA